MANKKNKNKTVEFARDRDDAPEYVLNVMSNDPNQGKFAQLQLFYRLAMENSIAYADLKDVTTGDIVPVLVGFKYNEDTGMIDSYPLAKIVQLEECNNFQSPDGKGGYA